MTQTTYTDNVAIQGRRDINQLVVQGYVTQTTPLQNWQDNAANLKAQVTGDGRFQIGNNLGTGAPVDALIQANQDITLPSSLPQSAWHTLGRITGTLTSGVNWVVHELQLLGSGGVSGLHTAMRSKITHNNSGNSTSAELRAGDMQSINQTGSNAARVNQITGLRATASNSAGAYLNKAVGIEAALTNDSGGNVNQATALSVLVPNNGGPIGSLTGIQVATPTNVAGGSIATAFGVQVADQTAGASNYALYTGIGPNRFGDQLQIVGSSDRRQLIIQGAAVQNNTLQEWQNSGGTPLSVVDRNGWIGAGRTAPTSTLHTASLGVGVVYVVADHLLNDSDLVCLANAGSGPIAVILPLAASVPGRIYIVKRISGGPSNVTVTPQAGQTIDGAANFVLSALFQAVRLVTDGFGWYLI